MNRRSFPLRAGGVVACALAASTAAQAASSGIIEEVVVTATKRESSLQDTAIAVSAFDQASLDRENIDDALDVQLSVPNLSFTQGNFTGSNLRIRGIGNNAVAASSDSGTAIAFNGAYLQTSSIFESEFFDVERVEVLRGPQGTLYGRNTTGGVVNIIPAKADPTTFEASLNGEIGNYENRKANGMVNVPLGERAALRVSGMLRERDGYVDNRFNGEEIDDRDLWSTRVALNFAPTDTTTVDVFWQHFEEDDTRMRTNNQTCEKDTRPFPLSLGCLPNRDIESFDVLNSNAQLGGILSFLQPPGTPYLPFNTDAFANSTRTDDLREVNTEFTPIYEMEEDIFNAEIVQDWGDYTLKLNASYQEVELFTQTDYDWAVPSASYNPNVSFDALFGLPAGTTGFGYTDANGVMITPADPTVSGYTSNFAYDTSAYENEAFTLEGTVASNWVDEPFDFLAGFFYLESENSTIYDVRGNGLAALTNTTFADGPDGRPAPVSFYRSDTDDYQLDTWALFGEMYVDVTSNTRVTVGLRYSEETKEVNDRTTLLNTLQPGTTQSIAYEEGISNRPFLQNDLAGLIGPGGAFAGQGFEIYDPRFHGFGVSGNNPVPPYREFKDDWNEMTGKLAIESYIDLGFTDETLAFATLSRSYKSGGINPPSFTGAFEETFEPEFINAVEVGAKNRLYGGRMQANFTYFFYDYSGLQTTKIIDRTSVNENIDAEIQGMELELNWIPVENFRIDAFASWLDTEITGGTSINPANPTNGNADWINIKNSDASVFIAPTAALGDPNYTFDQSQCGQNRLQCTQVFTSNPATSQGGAGLSTQQTLVPIGIASDLSGNQLPGTPEFSVKLGAQYSFFFGNGMELVPRVDWYWQDEFYYRVYNTEQDKIDAWSVTNASVTLYGNDGQWFVEAFGKNLGDDDYLTGAYFTDASSANFTNVFVLEPRTYGLTFGARF